MRDVAVVCSHLRRGRGEGGNRLSSKVHSGRMRSTGMRLRSLAFWLACFPWEAGPEAPWGPLPPGESAEQNYWLPWQTKCCFPQKCWSLLRGKSLSFWVKSTQQYSESQIRFYAWDPKNLSLVSFPEEVQSHTNVTSQTWADLQRCTDCREQ